jgi:hypothetical protein
MPVLAITNSGHPILAFFTVLTVMLFPDDEVRREELIREVVNGEDYRSSEIARRSLSASMTGLILVRIRTLAATDPSRASVEQIIGDLVRERRGKPKRSGISRRSLWRMWKSNRTVAHLCASYFFYWAAQHKRKSPFSAKTFLRTAEDFRLWGESFIPPRAKKFRSNRARPLLDRDRTWKLVPEGSQTAATMP